MNAETRFDAGELPRLPADYRAPLWWGIVGLILVESVVFATLVASYFYLGIDQPEWPPAGTKAPDLVKPTLGTLVLMASSLPMHWADRGITRGNQTALRWGLLLSIALAVTFLVLKYIEYSEMGYRWYTHSYGSISWTIIGFHSTHVVALILKTVVVSALAWIGYFSERRSLAVKVNGIYWHFVVAVWIPLYATLYWMPRVLK